MSERPGYPGAADREAPVIRLKDLPLYYQQLGVASHELGLAGEFYRLVDEGYDFGVAFISMCHYIKEHGDYTSHDEVRQMLASRYAIDYDQEDFIDETEAK